MTMMENKQICAGGCGSPGICSVKGSNEKYCVLCMPREEPGPCDRVVDDEGQRCGVTENTIGFKTPSGVRIVRCAKHRIAHDLIKEPELGY